MSIEVMGVRLWGIRERTASRERAMRTAREVRMVPLHELSERYDRVIDEAERERLAATIEDVHSIEPLEPGEPLSREEAEARVQRGRDRLARVTAYEAAGRWSRAWQVARYCVGRESDFLPLHQRYSDFPDVIAIGVSGGGIGEVVVDERVEQRYRGSISSTS
jgi:hypothetical protein